MNVEPGETIAVWFSCGAASAVAAKLTLEQYPENIVRVVNNPVIEEHEDNGRFLRDVARWLGVEIESATNTRYPSCSCVDVWDDRAFMSGPKGAPCTNELKKMARKQWEMSNTVHHHVLGFTAGEERRHERFVEQNARSVIPVLISGGVTKGRCFQIIRDAGIELPKMYELGYPNANCIGCVKATSPTYWNHVRRTHPEVFKQRAEQSREIGAKLVRVKNKRIYLDELDPNAKGQPMKGMDFECGIFCGGGN